MLPTIPELARLCGVSRGTVDRALNGRPDISDKTRAHVLKIAQQNGYVPNVLARSLVTGKSNTIAIVVFDLRNRHFAQMINAIQQNIFQAGYFSYICITEKDRKRETQILRDLAARKVDGIIIIPINKSPAFEEELLKLHVPTVTVSNRLSSKFSYVGADFRLACYEGMQAFYEKGYRNVSFICPCADEQDDVNAYAQIQRAKGYASFMNEHPEMHGSLITSYDYCDIILQSVHGRQEKIGFFCSSDYYALNILAFSRKQGLDVPKDFGLMGFDGIDTLDYIEKQLSTIVYPIENVGKSAAELLNRLIANADAPHDVFVDFAFRQGNTL